jgi:hypothetical protein
MRASATRARFKPRRLASAQYFKLEIRVVRVSITLAHLYSVVRIASHTAEAPTSTIYRVPAPRNENALKRAAKRRTERLPESG